MTPDNSQAAGLALLSPLAIAGAYILLRPLFGAARAIWRNARTPTPEPTAAASTPQRYRTAIAAAEAYAEAAEPGTVRDAVWDRAYLQMLTAQGLAISTRQATGDAYPYGFALPAEYLGKFFGPEHTPWIVWAKDAA